MRTSSMPGGLTAVIDFLGWPVDIWAEIFSRLEPRSYPPKYLALSSRSKVIYRNSLNDLRLTCHKFKQICDQHPATPRRLIFCQHDPSLFINKLLVWLKASRDITSLVCFSSEPCLGMLLPQLMAAPTQLRHISMSAVNAANISSVSAYTNLVSCQLNMPTDQEVQLQSLMPLKNLESLVLRGGKFCELSLSDRLTGLFMKHATVACAAHSASTNILKHLSLVPESCLKMPGIGISACTALVTLELQQSSITAECDDDWYQCAQCPPDSASKMLALSNFSVNVQAPVLHMERFGLLTALENLKLLYAESRILTGDVGGLSKLQTLLVSPMRLAINNKPVKLCSLTAIGFWIDWSKLKGLRSVDLQGHLKFSSSVLQLVQLPVLSQFSLQCFTPGDAQTSEHIAALGALFATQRPDINVRIEYDTDLSDGFHAVYMLGDI